MTDKDTSKPTAPAKVKAPLTPIDSFRIDLQERHAKAINNFFRGDEKRVMKFMSSVVYSMQTVPKLMECSRDSVISAFMTCAEYELYPSSASGEAYVLPYKGEAQFQLGYQGVITLLYRAGMKNITAEIVYEKDDFEYQAGLTPKLIHRPNVFQKRGEAIGVYAVATLPSGETQFKVLGKDDIMKFKEFSKSKGSEYSPWNPKNDPELSMWKKTAIKQLAKFLPKNSAVYEAFEKDNKDSRISDAKLLAEKSDLKMGNLLKENNDESQETGHEEETIQIGETGTADNPKKG